MRLWRGHSTGQQRKVGSVLAYSRECAEEEGAFATMLEVGERWGQPGLRDLPSYLLKQYLSSALFTRPRSYPVCQSPKFRMLMHPIINGGDWKIVRQGEIDSASGLAQAASLLPP